MKAELIPMAGGRPLRISKDVTVVGRRDFCDIQIDDPSLSKRHCVLVKTDGLLVVRDLATTNGTKVKGQKIRWAALLPEDRLTLGSIKFRVYLGPDEDPSPSEPGYVAGAGRPGPAPSAQKPAPSAQKPAPVPSRALSAPRPKPMAEADLPPIGLDGGDWLDAARAGIAADEDDADDLIIDLD